MLSSFCRPLAEWDRQCRAHGRFIPQDVCDTLAALTEKILVLYNYLACFSIALGKCLYHLIPKLHMFSHIGYDMCYQANPRSVHCYSDENMVGKVKRICERCHARTVAFRCVSRYVIMISIRWWMQLAVLRGLD